MARQGRVSLITLLVVAISIATDTAAVSGAAGDRDGDGLRDSWEQRWGVTSASDADSDGDGLLDAAEDPDDDRLSNLGEQRFRTSPSRPDTDGDGIGDWREDSDRDGRRDGREQDRRPVPAGLRPSLPVGLGRQLGGLRQWLSQRRAQPGDPSLRVR